MRVVLVVPPDFFLENEMRQDGILTDGRAAKASVTVTDEIPVITTPGAQHIREKVTVGTLVGTPGGMAAAYIDFNAAGEAGMTITIGGVVYTEADTADAENGVWTNGASAASSATSLLAALNGDTRATVPFTAVADETGDGVWLFWDSVGDEGNVEITTDSEANCTVPEAAVGGADTAAKHIMTNIVHTVTAQELLSGTIDIPIAFTPVGFQITATSATGAPVYFTDLVTIEEDPDRVRITTDGGTNLADTNIVYLTVWG
ncbi:MAG: hypothetical protein WCQ69_09360 [Bacteroidales bacterium]